MQKRVREDLTGLFEQWLDGSQARTAAEEIRAAEQLIDAYPSPLPSAQTLELVKQQMYVRRSRRRVARMAQAVATVAAVVAIVIGLVTHVTQRPGGRIDFGFLLPATLWETNDIAVDDVELAYLTSEVKHLEAQVRAAEGSDSDASGINALNEAEMELFQIDTEFWKG